MPNSDDPRPIAPPNPGIQTLLKDSVGNDGGNKKADVFTVQNLLEQRGLDPGKIDGICGEKTIDTIVAFQLGFLKVPDGRVDVDGRTWFELRGF